MGPEATYAPMTRAHCEAYATRPAGATSLGLFGPEGGRVRDKTAFLGEDLRRNMQLSWKELFEPN